MWLEKTRKLCRKRFCLFSWEWSGFHRITISEYNTRNMVIKRTKRIQMYHISEITTLKIWIVPTVTTTNIV